MKIALRACTALTAVLAAAGGVLLLPSGTPASAAVDPTAPTGLFPNDGPSHQYKNLELRWHDTGAAAYEVQVSDDGSFAKGHLLDATTYTPRYAPPTLLPAGTYVWRVRAAGHGWSALAQFTRGWDSAPTSPSGTVDRVPVLSWDALPDASFYEVEITPDPVNGAQPPVIGSAHHWTCYTDNTYFALYGVVAGKEQAPGDEGNCPTMAAVDPSATSAPTPSPSASASASPTPSPSTSPGAGSSPTLPPDHIPPGTYFWRVRGRDGTVDARTTPFADPAVACTGVWYTDEHQDNKIQLPEKPPKYLNLPECSSWSASGTLVVPIPTGAVAVPGVPSTLAVAPSADGSATDAVVSNTPTFSWSAVPGTAKYRLYVSRTPDIRDAFRIYETMATSMQPVDEFADRSVPLYWTVQACGIDSCGDPAPVHSFVRTSAVTTAVAAATPNGRGLVLPWTVSAGAVGIRNFEVQIADARGSFDSPVMDRAVDRIADRGTDGSHYTLDTGSLPVGPYQWRVRPLDQSGNPLPWSAPGSFFLGTQVGAGTIDSASRYLSHSAAWGVHGASDAVGGTYLATGSAGQQASAAFVGSQLTVVACKAPTYGHAQVVLDGRTVAVLDLKQGWSSCDARVWTSPRLRSGSHTVVVAPATGKDVIGLDALIVR